MIPVTGKSTNINVQCSNANYANNLVSYILIEKCVLQKIPATPVNVRPLKHDWHSVASSTGPVKNKIRNRRQFFRPIKRLFTGKNRGSMVDSRKSYATISKIDPKMQGPFCQRGNIDPLTRRRIGYICATIIMPLAM